MTHLATSKTSTTSTHSRPTVIPSKMAAIFRLPDEILLKVMFTFEGSQRNIDLRHLARTHSRFQGVVHEALIRNGMVPISSVPEYMELLHQHSEWIPLINHIEFGATHTNSLYNTPTASAVQIVSSITRMSWSPEEITQMDDLFHSNVMMGSVWTGLLIVYQSDLERLSVRSSPSVEADCLFKLLRPFRVEAEFDLISQPVTHHLADRIQILDLTAQDLIADDTWQPAVQLCHLTSRKILSVTEELIHPSYRGNDWLWRRYHHVIDFGPTTLNTLPPNLQILQIFCTNAASP